MLFMAITSTGSAEGIAVSSLVCYDIYREYINPQATGKDILFLSQVVICCFCVFMGFLSCILYWIGLGLGWVYLFMGIVIGSAVIPLWNMMMWKDANATGAVVAAWTGQICAVVVWISVAAGESGEVTIDSLGGNYPMLAGNLTAIFLSGFIHIAISMAYPQNYDWKSMAEIELLEDDQSGLDPEDYTPAELEAAYAWIFKYGLGLTIIFVIVWPALSLPEGVFSKSYFAFWVFISIMWGFCAAAVIITLPIYESSDAIMKVINGMMGVKEEAAAPPPGGTYLKWNYGVKDAVDEAHAKEKFGSRPFPQAEFDAIKGEDGTVTRAQFMKLWQPAATVGDTK